jgi:hypothetical protein
METTSTQKTQGRIDFEIRDKDGNLKDSWSVNNMIVNAGKAQLALLAIDATAVPFTFLAVGSGTTAPALSQTTLATEATLNGFARAAATVTRVTTTVTNDTARLTKTFTATGSQTIEEIGIFNAASAGTMLGRALTTTKLLTSGDTLACTYNIIFS